jgi:ATP-dependent 26S proteasome regulatory subunit
MKDAIIEYMKAGYPGLYLVSHEEQRVRAEVLSACTASGRTLHAWSCTQGLVRIPEMTKKDKTDPIEMLDSLSGEDEKTVYLCQDFHLFMGDPGRADPNPVLVRKVKETLLACKQRLKTLIIVGARQWLPPELEKELTVLDFALPDKAQLREVLMGVLESAKRKPLASELEDEVLRAAGGMTTAEAENAFALSIVRHKGIKADVIAHEKAQVIKKGGLLEVIESTLNLDSIGGLDELKGWINIRKKNFSDKASAKGVPTPKGALFVGYPGSGKTLTAKAIANILGVPLFRADGSSFMGSLVGESEGKMKRIQQTTEAAAPCVLMIDEIEKLMNGSQSSGQTDGGTMSRVLGSFLSWMNDKVAPVFIVATANNVDQLPPELLRKGRWDQIWFVDLPTLKERKGIWEVVIRKQYTPTGPRRDPKDFDVNALASQTEGFVGAELEQMFVDAVIAAFSEDREPTTADIVTEIKRSVPLSVMMKAQLEKARAKIAGNARNASSESKSEPVKGGYGRKVETTSEGTVVNVAIVNNNSVEGAN